MAEHHHQGFFGQKGHKLRVDGTLCDAGMLMEDAPHTEELVIYDLENRPAIQFRLDGFPNLKKIAIVNAASLVALPSSLCRSSTLTSLDLYKCATTAIPAIPTLRTLMVHDTPTDTIPFGEMPNMEELSLTYTALECIHTLPATLRTLNISYNSELKELPANGGHLRQLESFTAASCANLKTLPDNLFSLPCLHTICVPECYRLQRLYTGNATPSVTPCSQLVLLNLTENRNLESVPSCVFSLRSLRQLNLKGCRKLAPLPGWPWGTINLRSIDLPSHIHLSCVQLQHMWNYNRRVTLSQWSHPSCRVLMDLVRQNAPLFNCRTQVYTLLLWNSRQRRGSTRLPGELLLILLRDFVRE